MIIQIGPVIVALLAVPLFGERLHAWLLAGMVVGFAGVAVIARGSTTDADASLLGVVLVLVAAAMYAVGVLTQKVLLRRLPSVQVVFVSFLMGAVICLPFASDLPAHRRRRRRRAVVDRLPRRAADRGRLHDVGLRAHPHRRRRAVADDVPRAGDRDADRVAARSTRCRRR